MRKIAHGIMVLILGACMFINCMPITDTNAVNSCILTINAINSRGEVVNDTVNANSEEILTNKINVYKINKSLYDAKIKVDGNGEFVYNPNTYLTDKYATSTKALIGGNNETDEHLLFGRQYDIDSICDSVFEVGEYYSLQAWTYDESPYSWKIEGTDEYINYGSSIYFKLTEDTKLTCNYLYDWNSYGTNTVDIETLTDFKGKTNTMTDSKPTVESLRPSDVFVSPAQYYGLADQVQYVIKNKNGEILKFREVCGRFYYEGIQTDGASLNNVRGLSHLYDVPDGEYTIQQLQTVDYAREDMAEQTFTVGPGGVTQLRFLNIYNLGKITLYQYYGDNESPKPAQYYYIVCGSSSNAPCWFVDNGIAEDGVHHYMYTGIISDDPQEGLTNLIEVTGERRTIVEGLETGMLYTYSNEDFFAGDSENGEYESYSLHYSFPEIIRQHYFNNRYGMKKIQKKDSLTGEKTDATFAVTHGYYTYDTSTNQYITKDNAYKFQHHDSMTIRGVEYKNVYEVVGVEDREATKEDYITTQDGEAVIYYPIRYNLTYTKRYSETYHKNVYDNFSASIFINEKEAADGYEVSEETYKYYDLYSLSYCSDWMNNYFQEYNGVDTENFKPLILEERWYSEEIIDAIIENTRYPSVKKTVDNGVELDNSDEFDFELYEEQDGDSWKKIDSFKLKANETKFFMPKVTNSKGQTTGVLENGKTYLVREKTKDGYELKNITSKGEGAEVVEDTKGKALKFTYTSGVPVLGEFENHQYKVSTEIKGTKTFVDKTQTYNKQKEFEFILKRTDHNGKVTYLNNGSTENEIPNDGLKTKVVLKANTNGSFTFPKLYFYKAGNYTFTVNEIKPENTDGINYDETEYKINVVVTEHDGELEVDWTVNGQEENNIEFTNKYEGKKTVNIKTGDELSVFPWVIMLIVSIIMILATKVYCRRKSRVDEI